MPKNTGNRFWQSRNGIGKRSVSARAHEHFDEVDEILQTDVDDRDLRELVQGNASRVMSDRRRW